MSSPDAAARYVKDVLIGKGSYGDVFSGTDTATGKRVALKVIDLEAVDDDIDEVRHEVAALADCCCPQITEYYSSVLLPNTTTLLIAMELMACSASDLVEAAPLDEASLAYALRQIVHALAYLHAKHRMHRDVKAANVLLTPDAVTKISDFGVSGQLSSTLGFKRRTFVGTPYWMAPEVIESSEEGYTKAADIWSLGITAIEMATQRPPHADLHPMRVLFHIPKCDPPVLEGAFSAELKDFVAKCLVKDPLRRPQAHELLSHPFIQVAEPPATLRAAVTAHMADRKAVASSKSDAGKKSTMDGTIKLLPPSAPAWDFAAASSRSDTIRASHVSTGTVKATRKVDRYSVGTFKLPRDLLEMPLEGEEGFKTRDAREMSASRGESDALPRLATPPAPDAAEGPLLTQPPARRQSSSAGGSRHGDAQSGRPRGLSALSAEQQAQVASSSALNDVLAPSVKAAALQAYPTSSQHVAAAAENVVQALSQLEAACKGSCLRVLSEAMLLTAAANVEPSADVQALQTLGHRLFVMAGPAEAARNKLDERPMRTFLLRRWQEAVKQDLLRTARSSVQT